MRIAYEFKVSPEDVLNWEAGLFDYACVFISEKDKKELEAQHNARGGNAGAKQPTMRGGRR